MGALPLLVSSPFAGCPIIQCFSFLKGKRGKRQILLFWFVSAQCSNPSPKNELVSTRENWLPWINPCSSSDHSLLSCLTWDKTFCRCSRQKVKAWNVAKDLHCNFLFSCCLDSLTAARLSGKEKRNKMPQITMFWTDASSLSVSLCLSFPVYPIPLFLLSSIAPSHRKSGLPENKSPSMERDKDKGGRYVWGRRGCFCHSTAPLVTASLNVVHPEEAKPSSLWSGLGPTRAPS